MKRVLNLCNLTVQEVVWKPNRWTVLSHLHAKLRTHQERVRHMLQQSTAAAARAPLGTASCGCQKQRQTSHDKLLQAI